MFSLGLGDQGRISLGLEHSNRQIERYRHLQRFSLGLGDQERISLGLGEQLQMRRLQRMQVQGLV